MYKLVENSFDYFNRALGEQTCSSMQEVIRCAEEGVINSIQGVIQGSIQTIQESICDTIQESIQAVSYFNQGIAEQACSSIQEAIHCTNEGMVDSIQDVIQGNIQTKQESIQKAQESIRAASGATASDWSGLLRSILNYTVSSPSKKRQSKFVTILIRFAIQLKHDTISTVLFLTANTRRRDIRDIFLFFQIPKRTCDSLGDEDDYLSLPDIVHPGSQAFPLIIS